MNHVCTMRLSSQLSTALHLTNIAVYGAVWATRYVSLLLLPSLDEVDVTSGTYYAFYIAAGVRATSIQLNRYSGCFLLPTPVPQWATCWPRCAVCIA